ncbi:MAG: hypothetical protein ACRCWS_02695 [Propionibacteriaceae bacterium]
MVTTEQLHSWWLGLSHQLRSQARMIAQRPAPRTMLIDELTASMLVAGLPTARQVWTGQPESLVEMLDEIAAFVLAQA